MACRSLCERKMWEDINKRYFSYIPFSKKEINSGWRTTTCSSFLNFMTFGIWMLFVFAAEPPTGFGKFEKRPKKNPSSIYRSITWVGAEDGIWDHISSSVTATCKELAYAGAQKGVYRIFDECAPHKSTNIIDIYIYIFWGLKITKSTKIYRIYLLF